MAFDFDGVNQSIDASSAVLTAAPLTFSAMANVDNVTTRFVIVSLSDSNTQVDHFVITMAGQVAGDPVEMFSQSSIGAGTAPTTTGFSASTWNHVAGSTASATERAAYLNGASKGTNATNITPGGVKATSIGRLWRPIASNAFTDGRIAEVAIWNVALTDDEIVSLSKGFKPYRIRPQSLRFYAPLIRNVQDLSRSLALTNNNGATVARHPRVY
jgi:hypothetical protein